MQHGKTDIFTAKVQKSAKNVLYKNADICNEDILHDYT
jgi:hypothetical protein